MYSFPECLLLHYLLSLSLSFLITFNAVSNEQNIHLRALNLILSHCPTTSHLLAFLLPTSDSMLGYLRGLRPRSDQKVSYLFAVVLGVSSGWYTYHEMNAGDVAAYHERNAIAAAAAKPK